MQKAHKHCDAVWEQVQHSAYNACQRCLERRAEYEAAWATGSSLLETQSHWLSAWSQLLCGDTCLCNKR